MPMCRTHLEWRGMRGFAPLNVRLPKSIRIMACEETKEDFHARFDAVGGKIYAYRLWRGTVMSPFEHGRAWHLYGTLDLDLLRMGAALLTGTHNFARLSANRGDISEDERRENAGRPDPHGEPD